MLKLEDNITKSGKQHRFLLQLHKKNKNGLSETLFGFVKTNLRKKMFRLESVYHLMVNHGEVDSLMAYCSD